jgi:hypothetical protein
MPNKMRIVRTSEGPCLFCLRKDVVFDDEHLPPESVVGAAARVLVNWVCQCCNGRLSREDAYFANHYHGALARSLQAVRGKKGRGAGVQRKDVEAKYDPATNTARLRLKRTLNTKAASPEFLRSGVGRVELECRTLDPRRLGRSLAKIGLETLACYTPAVVHESRFDKIREYALGLGGLTFLPYALGVSRDSPGVRLCEIQFEGEDRWVAVALIALPLVSYAVQLSDFDDLHPLWHVAQFAGMIFDQDATPTRRVRLNLELRDMRGRS